MGTILSIFAVLPGADGPPAWFRARDDLGAVGTDLEAAKGEAAEALSFARFGLGGFLPLQGWGEEHRGQRARSEVHNKGYGQV